jgi:hypothetical protein
MVEGRIEEVSSKPSDLDIGVKPEKPFTVEEKVKIAILFEDLFDVSRVDLIVLPEAPVFLALEIVTGEVLYRQDSTYEAEYQLYIISTLYHEDGCRSASLRTGETKNDHG